MPEFSAHFRSHKQARSRKLAKRQRKYQESMASSTIFNRVVMIFFLEGFVVLGCVTYCPWTEPTPHQPTGKTPAMATAPPLAGPNIMKTKKEKKRKVNPQ